MLTNILWELEKIVTCEILKSIENYDGYMRKKEK